ncbi:heat stress transcription factor A-5 [Impatiens glandulifera]|uniref:heat stress transcription factor A-5 n=1 Tax=Impatiens glandulifera TaxID=253017 RepID=UPI001FB11127|nr:heat stress transcription factor A-5 [Impatiens glandulifera]
MDGGGGGASASGGGGGGPAPFLQKTYEMVDDSSTDQIVSWSSTKNSFVVWNPPEFARLLLPMYFKHNNFSSFIRQLNTYGFRKIDPEKWEFANEEFMKDQKHLLKNIHRRKPIHSHSNPQGNSPDQERAAYEGEISKLLQEKLEIQAKVLKYKDEQSTAKIQLDDLSQRVDHIKQRQDRLLEFIDKASQNPDLVAILARKLQSVDFSAYNKKRRVPRVISSEQDPESSSVGTHSSSRPEFGAISNVVSDVNLVSNSMQCSNEEDDNQARSNGGVLFFPETLDLSDTGTSLNFQRQQLGQEEADNSVSCHLNLSLAYPKPSFVQNQDSLDDDGLSKNRIQANGDGTKVRVNDVFWEQFLTEKPGSSETEEGSSNNNGHGSGKATGLGNFMTL